MKVGSLSPIRVPTHVLYYLFAIHDALTQFKLLIGIMKWKATSTK